MHKRHSPISLLEIDDVYSKCLPIVLGKTPCKNFGGAFWERRSFWKVFYEFVNVSHSSKDFFDREHSSCALEGRKTVEQMRSVRFLPYFKIQSLVQGG